jgi:flagellar biosynthesis GTPase FlhF
MRKPIRPRVTLPSRRELLVSKFIGMSEHEFTVRVVIPFFEAVGYSKIDYHGGPDEEGKDLVCWTADRLGHRELSVAQVKMFRPTRSDSDNRNFSGIVSQLSKCVEKRVPHTDGNEYLPSTVYFVTPHPIDTRTLLTRFQAFETLRGGRLKIVDGALIAERLEKMAPSLVNELCGSEFPLQGALETTLNNETVMKALQVREMRALPEIYTDLDFFLGRASARTFLRSNFGPGSVIATFQRPGWVQFLRHASFIQQRLGASVLGDTSEAVERDYEAQMERMDEWTREESDCERKLAASQKTVLEARQRILLIMPAVDKKPVNIALNKFEKLMRADLGAPKLDAPKAADLTRRLLAIPGLTKSLKPHTIEIEGYTQCLEQNLAGLQQAQEIQNRRSPPPRFKCSVNGEPLVQAFNAKREWLKAQVTEFNRRAPTVTSLKAFLLETAELFAVVHEAITDETICETLGIHPSEQSRDESIEYLMSISLHRIFDTGLNLSVLGEAGAGKTTTLQMYAYRCAEKHEHRLALFVPAARAVRAWHAFQSERDLSNTSKDSEIRPPPALLDIIQAYIVERIPAMKHETLERMFVEGSVIVLVDGIDEAINEAPWLLQAIGNAARTYPRAQFVLSSRMSGHYLRDLPFQACTLRAFTSRQRTRFVKDWFRHARTDYSKAILNHLKATPVLSRVVRNPLLVTLLCTLAENGVPLPTGELRLYEDRQRLFLGYYDMAKGIARLSTAMADLDRVSSSIALWLHGNNLRQAPVAQLYERAAIAFHHRLSQPYLVRVVDELIDPCNVLVPMTTDGQFGFGHLRFQEYLAARELLNDRGRDLVSIMAEPWWHDVLLFYAELANSLDWLILTVAGSKVADKAWDTLGDMVKKRSATEARQLRALMNELRGPTKEWLQFDDSIYDTSEDRDDVSQFEDDDDDGDE